MIHSYLHSLAALLRQLIAQGRAVHCTEADAAELELLAGLFEHEGPMKYQAQSLTIPAGALKIGEAFRIDAKLGECEVTPADIAHGWLRASRAPLSVCECGCRWEAAPEDDIKRAATCAEMAAACVRMSFLRNHGEPGLFFGECDPYAGCPEAARAAWGHIIEQLDSQVAPARVMSVARGMVGYCHPLNATIDKYRRELEAMKC